MSEFISQFPITELPIRMSATTLIVVLVSWAVGKLGSVAGGLVAGLPIGFGPGYFFLLGTAKSGSFLFQSAMHSLLAISATQLFLTSYLITAKNDHPNVSLSLAICVWWGAIYILSEFTFATASVVALFIIVTIACRWIGRRFQMPGGVAERREPFSMVLFRAALGGLLVGLVTVFASFLGAKLSGILLAFPIGYALISLNIHKQFGPPTVVGVLYSALY